METAIFYAQGQGYHNQPVDPGSSDFIAAYNTYRSKRPLCTHCGLLGHTVNKCYQIYSYPPGYRAPSGGAFRPTQTAGGNVRSAQTGTGPRGSSFYTTGQRLPQTQPLQSSMRQAQQNQRYYSTQKDSTVALVNTEQCLIISIFLMISSNLSKFNSFPLKVNT